MRKLERDLLALADRWEDVARQLEKKATEPLPTPPHCCSLEHEKFDQAEQMNMMIYLTRKQTLLATARELRELVQNAPANEPIAERLAAYAGRDV